VEVQIVEPHLSNLDSSTGNKPDKSYYTNRKVLKKKYSEVVTEEYYKGKNLLPVFPSLQTRK
jgi:hypothetical protein